MLARWHWRSRNVTPGAWTKTHLRKLAPDGGHSYVMSHTENYRFFLVYRERK
jgi:hypothetical protein